MQIIDIAEDYRRQRVEAEAKKLNFATMGRAHFVAWVEANRARLLDMARSNGLKDEAALESVEEYLQLVAASPLRSEYDDISGYLVLKAVIDRIENICREESIAIHEGVVFGVFPGFGANAFQLRVPTTDASIIAVSTYFIPFCNQLSKLITKSLPYTPDGGEFRVSNDPAEVRSRLNSEKWLSAYWALSLTHFAVDGSIPQRFNFGNFDVPESVTRIQILDSMDTFAIAHEYGHHIARHGNIVSSQSAADIITSEFEADLFARGITMRFGDLGDLPNLYATSGSGAVILLGAAELVDRVTRIIFVDNDSQSKTKTHLSLDERIINFAKLDENISPDMQATFRDMRGCFREIIEVIWREVEPAIHVLAKNVDFASAAKTTV